MTHATTPTHELERGATILARTLRRQDLKEQTRRYLEASLKAVEAERKGRQRNVG